MGKIPTLPPTKSSREIRRLCTKLGGMDLKRAKYQFIKNDLSTIFGGLSVNFDYGMMTDTFFRVRANPKNKITKVSELLAPPRECVAGYQRCNGPSEPKFYAASRRVAALIECRVQEGNIVYLSQWMPQNPILTNTSLNPLHPAAEFYEPINDVAYTFLHGQFSRRIDPLFSDDYKITAAAATMLTPNFQTRDIDHKDDGIAMEYPSVVDIEDSYNTVFSPKIAARDLKLLHVMELRITGVEHKEIRAEITDTSRLIHDGEIDWREPGLQLPKPRKKNAKPPFIELNGELVLDTVNSTDPDAPSDLEEYLRKILTE